MFETINGKQYKVTQQPSGDLTKENMQELGWDGFSYMLEGSRGAVYLAYRSVKTGQLTIICNLRF